MAPHFSAPEDGDSHHLQSASSIHEYFPSTSLPTYPDMVELPDLFVSWAKEPLITNVNYETVAPLALKWFKELCGHDSKEHKRYVKAKFGYFVALWAPDAGADEYRTACDWVNWIFAFDDKIDEGVLKGKPELVKEEVDAARSILSDHPISYSVADYPVRYTLELVWQRIIDSSRKGVQRRFRNTINDYLDHVLEQAYPHSMDSFTDLDSFTKHHQGSSCVKPIPHLLEHCYGLNIPDYVFENPAIQRLQELSPELTLLANDIYSYAKEAKSGDNHNVIYLLRTQGMSHQQAFNQSARAIYARYDEWDAVVAQVPRWGEKVDIEVQKFVKAIKIFVIANLECSFASQRYFGANNEVVRKTRMLPAVVL